MNKVIEVNGTEMTMDQIKGIILSRILVDKPGKYQCKVTQVGFYNPSEYGEEGNPRHIVNLSITTPYWVDLTKKALKEEDYEVALNSNLTRGVFLREDGSVRGYLPGAGDFVYAMVDYRQTEDGENALSVLSISAIPVTASKSLAGVFDDFFPADETNQTDEESSDNVENSTPIIDDEAEKTATPQKVAKKEKVTA